MLVLGIESSCDETAAAVVGPQGVLSDVVHTQGIHAAYGGVVPELAARAHLDKLGVTIRAALDGAGIDRPDAVAATAGPGLIGSVLVGLCWAKALALGWGVPFVAVHHLEGHLLSPMLEERRPEWPFLALVVSGGHTAIYRCESLGQYTLLGETLDDAAGEAYDKIARLLGLGWPGGPMVDRLAETGDPKRISFPRPAPAGLYFSFSGLKTAVRNHVNGPDRASDADICASFQAAVVDCLLDRLGRAIAETGIRRVAIAGGVAANRELRERASNLTTADVFLPPKSRCTDNGAMIAFTGRLHLETGHRDSLATGARPGWILGSR
ncbi:MAG: tRNA (adenosine(37)-N6)-threonylcarbamoyltransferase complex transferase subunit TsaD [Myxococcota bacterium]